MRVLYWTPRRKSESEEREAGLTFVPLDQLLAESDFVSLHSPLKAETRHQIGARELGCEKDRVLHQHRARTDHRRGGVRALGRAESPAPASTCSSSSPRSMPRCKKMRNVVLVPHLGSATVEVREEMANIVVDNILALASGRQAAQHASIRRCCEDRPVPPAPLIAVTDSPFPSLDPAKAALARLDPELRMAKAPSADDILAVARDADAVLVTYAKLPGDLLGPVFALQGDRAVPSVSTTSTSRQRRTWA